MAQAMVEERKRQQEKEEKQMRELHVWRPGERQLSSWTTVVAETQTSLVVRTESLPHRMLRFDVIEEGKNLDDAWDLQPPRVRLVEIDEASSVNGASYCGNGYLRFFGSTIDFVLVE